MYAAVFLSRSLQEVIHASQKPKLTKFTYISCPETETEPPYHISEFYMNWY